MNADVLFNIAGFCGIDGRRALGIPPSKLKRNTEFDQQLQAIHGLFQVIAEPGPMRHVNVRQEWRISLNHRILVSYCTNTLSGARSTTVAWCKWGTSFVPLRCSWYECDWLSECEQIKTYVLKTRVGDLGGYKWFDNGKWLKSIKAGQPSSDHPAFLQRTDDSEF
jgi:hypothetical protein